MTLLEAIILGIIQGLTEFLPVSSSGHLGLSSMLFGLEEEGLMFMVLLHVGTLVPVVAVFWHDVWALIKKPFQRMTYLLIVASVPVAVVGMLLRDLVSGTFLSLPALAMGFVVTGTVLLISDRFKKGTKNSDKITFFDALCIGIAQAVAIMPGISRSGSTISMALARGINRRDAAKFVFLMSIPTILGALIVEIIDLATSGEQIFANINPLTTAAGFLASMISGYFAIKLLFAAIKKAKLRYFAYYVLSLAAAIIIGFIIL